MTDLPTALGVKTSGDHVARSPIDGAEIGRVSYDDAASVETKIAASVEAFKAWRDVPAPKRGELVRLFGEELRANKGCARPSRHARSRQDPAGRASAKFKR